MLHLEDRHLRTVRSILERLAPGREVWAFGSRVHGRGLKRFSDLDLAIVGQPPLDVHTLEALRDAFAVSDLRLRSSAWPLPRRQTQTIPERRTARGSSLGRGGDGR